MAKETEKSGEHRPDIDEHKKQLIEIEVNFKPVKMFKEKVTGLEIKEAAIQQGVNIKVDFVLFEDLGNGQRRVVGDSDVVQIHEKEKFEAIPHDDNS